MRINRLMLAVEWVVRSHLSTPPASRRHRPSWASTCTSWSLPPGPAVWLAHAWVWAHNPSGMFADLNPEGSCP